MDFNGQYLGAYKMRLSYISDCLRRMDSRRAQTGALIKANAIIKHSRHWTATTLILKSYNANRLQSPNVTRWSSQLTAIESLTKLSMDMKDELYHNHTPDEGSIYECIFTSQFCYFEAHSTFCFRLIIHIYTTSKKIDWH